MIPEELPPGKERGWVRRFADAGRGVLIAVRGEASFFIHLLAGALVILLASALGLSTTRWCLVAVCVTIVFAAEMFNTAIEHLARAITREQHPEIRDALDIASGTVLVAAIGAAVVGLLVLGPPVLAWLG